MDDRSTRYLYAHALVKTVMYGTAGGATASSMTSGLSSATGQVPLLCVPWRYAVHLSSS